MSRPLCLLFFVVSLVSGHRVESSFLRPQSDGIRHEELLQQRTATDMQRLLALKPDGKYKRPVLSVYLMNGLGNQLFQVSALLALALEHNPKFAVALPNVEHVCCNRTTYWHTVLRKVRPLLQDGLQEESGHAWGVGSLAEFLGLSQTKARSPSNASVGCQVEQLPKFNPWDKDCRKATTFNATWASQLEGMMGCKTVMLSGYFQNKDFFSKHASFLQRLFWDEASVERAKKRLAALVPGHGKPVVSVHYRLGDYEPNGWVLSDEYYNEGLSKISNRLQQRPFCLIFSDDAPRAWVHSNSLDGCDGRALVPPEVDDVTSFYMMGLTEASILADSTFAYWAAFLGQKWKKVVVAPRIAARQGQCWSYLSGGTGNDTELQWVTVPAMQVSSGELLAEEVFAIG